MTTLHVFNQQNSLLFQRGHLTGRQDDKNSERHLQSAVKHSKGEVLRQLAHLRYDWLKQVAIMLVRSNWLALIRGCSGLQFSVWELVWTSLRLYPYLVITLSLLIVEAGSGWPGLALPVPGLLLAVGDERDWLSFVCACSVSGKWNGGLISEKRLSSLLRCLLSPFTLYLINLKG